MRPVLTILALLATTPLLAGGQVPPADVLEELSGLELASGEVYSVRDLTIRRDVVSVSFERGVIAFLEPVGARVTGAVFLGSGDVLAMPPDDVERRQMHKFTGSPILTERFDAAIIRFTDDTYEEILESIRSRAQEDVRADDLEALLPWGENLGRTSRLLNFRLLRDLVGSRDRPIFFAALRGERLGWFDIAYDQRSGEEVIFGDSVRSSGQADIQNIWASFNRRSEAGDRTLYGQRDADVDVSGYEVEAQIADDGGLRATARVGLRVIASGDRTVPFELTRSLRVSEVRFEGEPVVFFQHDANEVQFGRAVLDELLVVLPRPTTSGELLELEFDYDGTVLERRGDGVYYVSERVLWYPHVGWLDPALYTLTFHFPRDNVLVATGRLVDEWETAGMRHSRWESGQEFVVAGFNYGDFSVEADETGAVPIYVHVNNDLETVYEDLVIRRAVLTERVLRELQGAWRRRGGPDGTVPVQPDFELFSTRRLAFNVLDEVRAMLAFFSGELGAFPFDRLSVSQFPVPFSQGWPSLLYVSTLSFFDEEQRARLDLTGGTGVLDPEYVLAHEVAHQWFGNRVSWHSYRDQWISEGFANYMALLYIEEAEGASAAAASLGELKRRLLSRNALGTHDDNGPIWLGQRLSTSAVPDGYAETVYPKATWVVHMLRMLMRDGPDGSDERFTAMMREYLDKFGGSMATTWDLKAVLERHMTSRMDAEGDGTLDWFFDQWVFGTGVPEYTLSYDIIPQPSGTFVVRGLIEDKQRLGFTMPLSLYGQTSAGDVRYIGDVVVSGNEEAVLLNLDYRPSRILLDPFEAVLRR